VLVDLAVRGAPVRLKDVQPSRLPDLYAGQELVVFGRYESTGAPGAGELSIGGTRGGRPERFAARVEFPAHAASGGYIPGLWAARQVGELMRTIRIEGATPERVAEVRDLALRHGLVTEYTSYLVQEPPGAFAAGARLAGIGTGIGTAIGGRGAAPRATAEADVQSARVDALRRQARSVADAAVAERAVVGGMTPGGDAGTRIVAGRRFGLDAGAWIDAGHSAQATVVEVEPFSAAYFAVLARLPELTPYWSTFDAVTVAGRQVSVRVTPGGRSTLTAREMESLVRDFRAR
jgi:hypothetical protein